MTKKKQQSNMQVQLYICIEYKIFFRYMDQKSTFLTTSFFKNHVF